MAVNTAAERKRDYYGFVDSNGQRLRVALAKGIYDTLFDDLGFTKGAQNAPVTGRKIRRVKDSDLVRLRVVFVRAGKERSGYVYCTPAKVASALKNLGGKDYAGEKIIDVMMPGNE